MGVLGGGNVENARGGDHFHVRCAPALPSQRRMWARYVAACALRLAPAITLPNLAFR